MARKTPDHDSYIQGPDTSIGTISGTRVKPASQFPEAVLPIRDTVLERPTSADTCIGCDGIEVSIDPETLSRMHIVHIR